MYNINHIGRGNPRAIRGIPEMVGQATLIRDPEVIASMYLQHSGLPRNGNNPDK